MWLAFLLPALGADLLESATVVLSLRLAPVKTAPARLAPANLVLVRSASISNSPVRMFTVGPSQVYSCEI